jgi:NurA-like 5'-3' nuclease
MVKRGGIAAVLLLVALGVVGGGCGSDSDSTGSVTKVEFEKQAEVICNNYESEKEETIVKLQQQFRSTPSEKEQEEIVFAILAPYEEMVQEVAELDPLPEGQEQKIESAIETMEEAAQKAKSNPKVVLTDDTIFVKADEQAEALGWDNCHI